MLSAAAGPDLELEFVNGPRDGQAQSLTGQDAIIGSNRQADVILPGDPSVADRHARVSWTETTIAIENLDAESETTVDGERITGETELTDSQIVCCGMTEMTFRRPNPGARHDQNATSRSRHS